MTAIGNPTAALTACIDVLANIPEPYYSPAVLPALIEARKALRGQPVPYASVETGACLWEAVCEMALDGDTRSADEMQEAQGAAVRAAREAMGTNGLRMTVLGWVPHVDAAWAIADTDNGKFPVGGQYGDSFDWEFVPGWIARNIDWSNPHCPTRRPEPRIPHLFPGDKIVMRSPLDDLDAGLRAWLVDEIGMEVEHGGGGCLYLRHEGPHGSYVLVTCEGGGGMPSPDSWQVGTYRDSDSDSILDFVSDQQALTLRMAVGAACGALADFVLPPVDELTEAVNLVVSGLELLDGVEFATAGTEGGDAGSFVTVEGVTFLFTVERFVPHAAAQEA